VKAAIAGEGWEKRFRKAEEGGLAAGTYISHRRVSVAEAEPARHAASKDQSSPVAFLPSRCFRWPPFARVGTFPRARGLEGGHVGDLSVFPGYRSVRLYGRRRGLPVRRQRRGH